MNNKYLNDLVEVMCKSFKIVQIPLQILINILHTSYTLNNLILITRLYYITFRIVHLKVRFQHM